VIVWQACAHSGHGGLFEACRRCNAFRWIPAEDRGVLVTAANGRLVEHSAVVQRLLVSWDSGHSRCAPRREHFTPRPLPPRGFLTHRVRQHPPSFVPRMPGRERPAPYPFFDRPREG
jgi:hypothetical protein